jgi:hypothetical protein
MYGNGRINQIASERPQPRQGAIPIGASKPLYPTTSDTKIAASFRVSATSLLPRLS